MVVTTWKTDPTHLGRSHIPYIGLRDSGAKDATRINATTKMMSN